MKNLENTLGIKPRPSPPTKMTAARTATTHVRQEVTPPNHHQPRRPAAVAQQTKHSFIAVQNPYAKKKGLPIKASSKTKTKTKSRVAVKPSPTGSIVTISKTVDHTDCDYRTSHNNEIIPKKQGRNRPRRCVKSNGKSKATSIIGLHCRLKLFYNGTGTTRHQQRDV